MKFKYVLVIEEGKDIFLIVEGLMNSLCSHEQRMNKRINFTNLEQAYRVEHLQEVMVGNKVIEVVVMPKVEEDTTTPIIEMNMVTKIILEEGATLLNLKTSFTDNISNILGANTI